MTFSVAYFEVLTLFSRILRNKNLSYLEKYVFVVIITIIILEFISLYF